MTRRSKADTDEPATGAGFDPVIRPVSHAETWLASLGVRKVNLIIRDANLDVQAFYERTSYAVEPSCVMARWLVDVPLAGGRR